MKRPSSHRPQRRRRDPVVRVHVIHDDIGKVGRAGHVPTGEPLPIDVIAVGHYQNVPPVNAERALDLAISKAARVRSYADPIITQFTYHQLIAGTTARPFFLPDPRNPARLIAVVGMGLPRRFSRPELCTLARELCWGLGMLGRKHLATVLIGAGDGNLSVEDAASAWVDGISAALCEASGSSSHLRAVTFVEAFHGKLERMHSALSRRAAALSDTKVIVAPLSTQAKGSRRRAARLQVAEPAPALLTVEKSSRHFAFSLLASGAAAPYERSHVDPKLVLETNDHLIGADNRGEQLRAGKSVHGRLLPAKLWQQVPTNGPLVVVLDKSTARIAWEMLAEPDVGDFRGAALPEYSFLGLARGLTRQLRIGQDDLAFAIRPADRKLRVLVVADPAEDRPLVAARQEAESLVEVFKTYNRSRARRRTGTRIQWTPLIGPKEATRDRVLRELQQEFYDVLHFAGHCEYRRGRPADSGWVFSDGNLIHAAELTQLGHVPSFVFLNGCGSGLMPVEKKLESSYNTPSCAEALLAGGVGNFVCTAWKVREWAAREFALALYRSLFGLDTGEPQPMHAAMREARLAAWKQPNGLHTWGAYQHYGDPYFRLVRATR